MARAASNSPSSRPAASVSYSLAEMALRLLVDHIGCGPQRRNSAAAWRFGPVVLVSTAADAASAAVRATLATRAVDPAILTVWDGPSLDGEIAAALVGDRLDRLAASLVASRLVVVDRIDRVLDPERQQALVHLLDTSVAAGTAWCVSVAAPPPDGLLPQCGSRLCGGLVVPGPTAVASGALPPRVLSLARVIRAAARHHDVPLTAVVGPARSRTVAAARSLAMYLARVLTGRSFQAIGAACGGRDHTTVLHGARVCAARIARDPGFAADVGRLVTELAGSPPAPRRCRSAVGSVTLARALGNRRRGRRRPA